MHFVFLNAPNSITICAFSDLAKELTASPAAVTWQHIGSNVKGEV